MEFALIGEKLGHSFSKPIHEFFGNDKYEIVEIEKGNLNNFFKNSDFKGINVTIPYKKDVMKFCDTISDEAISIGSINTIVRKNNKLHGFNTDIYGFLSSADSISIDFKGKKTLIFGSGGTSSTVLYAVRARGGLPIVISRNGENNYSNLEKHYDADIIVNTTPVGMYPNFDGSICDLSRFNNLSGVIDVVYNPLRTRLLQQAKELSIPHIGGMHMLVSQAKRAEELFFDRSIDINTQSVIKKIENNIENIVLIGMPGSGKTTIGRIIADKLCMQFVDTDKMIVDRAKMSIPEIFEKFGEEHFRKIESDCIKEVSVLKKVVISSGGGAILNSENVANLKMNSKIVFIDRDIDKLAVKGRPLSANLDAVCKLADIRIPIYKAISDVKIDNNRSIDDTILEIERVFSDENFSD